MDHHSHSWRIQLDARCLLHVKHCNLKSQMSAHRRPIPALKPDELDRLPLEVLRLRLQQANLVTTGRRPQLVRRLKEHIAAQTSSHRSSSASRSESPSSEEHNGDSSAPSPNSRPRSGAETESGMAGHLRDRSSSSPSTGTSRSSSVSTSPAERSWCHISNVDRRHKRHRRPSLRQCRSGRTAKERHRSHSPVRRVRRDRTRSRSLLYQHLYKCRRDRRSRSSCTSHAHARGSLRRHSRCKGSRRYNPSRHRRSVHDRLGPSSSNSDSDSGSEWDEDTPPVGLRPAPTTLHPPGHQTRWIHPPPPPTTIRPRSHRQGTPGNHRHGPPAAAANQPPDY